MCQRVVNDTHMQGGHGSTLNFNFVPTLIMNNKHEPATYLLYWIILRKTMREDIY
jgi:hypothetical protein